MQAISIFKGFIGILLSLSLILSIGLSSILVANEYNSENIYLINRAQNIKDSFNDQPSNKNDDLNSRFPYKVDSINFACNETFCFYSSPIDADSFNMRFSVPTRLQLLEIKMGFWNVAHVDSTGEGVDVVVWDDNGSGFPGEEIHRVNIPAADMLFFPAEYQRIDVSDDNLFFTDDFHVGVTTVDMQAGNQNCIVMDDGSCPSLRGSLFCDSCGGWIDVDVFNFSIQIKITSDMYTSIPIPNESNVSLTDDISVVFLEEMNAGTLMDTSVLVFSDLRGQMGVYLSYDHQSQTLTIDPDSDFVVAEKITVILTPGNYTSGGVPLSPGSSFSFTTQVNDGPGDFTLDGTYAAGWFLTEPVSADFDRDGWIDVAVSSHTRDSVSIIYNSGDGVLDSVVSYPVQDYPYDLVAADFNGDGYVDLATANRLSEDVSIAFNMGGSGFESNTTYGIKSEPNGITSIDLEGDGDIDLVVAGLGEAYKLINDGDGTFFVDTTNVINFTGAQFSHYVGSADVQNDGYADLIIQIVAPLRFQVLNNDGFGDFTNDSNYVLDVLLGSKMVEIVDLNNDNYTDFVALGQGSPAKFYTFINNGSGKFDIDSVSVAPATPAEPRSITTGDFDNDTDIDVMISHAATYNFLSLLTNIGDGTFNAPKYIMVNPPGDYNSDLCKADFDNDGDIDVGLIRMVVGNSDLQILLNTRQESGYIVSSVDSADIYHVQAADIDRDNYTDIIYSGSSDAGLFVSYGSPDKELSEPVQYLNISDAAVDVNYFDDDTLLDVVAINNSKIYLLTNDGGRDFEIDSVPAKNNRLDRTTPSIASGFFNDDVYLDIIYAPDQINYGDETGWFESTPSTLYFTFESVNVGDFNHDGLDDLLVTNGSEVIIYLNADPIFYPDFSEVLVSASLEVTPKSAITDFNRDRNLDFALVQPLSTPGNTSKLYVGIGNEAGGMDQVLNFTIDGIAFDLVVMDVDRDGKMDIALANGTTQQIEIYFGNGMGDFPDIEYIDIPAGADVTYVLATLDINRDGNPDYISGGPDGESINIAENDEPGTTDLLDEMVVSGYNGITLEIINPSQEVISQYYQTVAGADYWRQDIDQNNILDEESYDYNLQYGEYSIIIRERPGEDNVFFTVGVRVDGTAKATVFNNYGATVEKEYFSDFDSLIFYYMIEDVSSIQPPNGIATSSTPTFEWSNLAEKSMLIADSFHFQLDRYYDFHSPIYDLTNLYEPSFQPETALGLDSVFYWRFRSYTGTTPSEYSRTFAAYIAYSACGDANSDDVVNVSDAVWIINYVFVGGEPPDPLSVGDANCDGVCNVSDAVWIINYVFVGGNEPCDTDGDTVPDC
jgi:FG-GAP-like repeat/Bacterial Ig-like domain/Dockerin type I domain/FG-GAP repeat